MQNFHDLLSHLADTGQYKPNRTGVGTYASVGHMLKFDLAHSFPAITTKKLAFKTLTAELIGLFRGFDNAANFRALGCPIWDQNANETPSWLANPNRKGVDDLGRIYGVQWTKWRDTRVVHAQAQAQQMVQEGGYTLVAADPARATWVVERTINQLEEALRTLLTDPFNRRIIVNGWRPDEADLQCIPCCHVGYQFLVMPDGTLHSTLWQRSFDAFLAFNVPTLALLTHVMARLAGLQVGTATMFISDAHLYENHLEQVRTQLAREHFEPPQLGISETLQKVGSLAEIKGAFERIEPRDFWLEGYQSHETIKAPMAA